MPQAVANGVTVEVMPAATKLLVQSWTGAAPTVAGTAAAGGGAVATANDPRKQPLLSEPWPSRVGAASDGSVRVLCVSPVEWLVIGAEEPHAMLDRLHAALSESGVTATDVTQALAALQVSGPRTRELLSKACGLDFHPRVFGAGSCARTRLAQVATVLDAHADGESFTCYVARSYLEYLQGWLRDAAAEFRRNPDP